MTSSNRRVFMLQVAAGGAVLAGSQAARAQAPEKLPETDPYAKSMGFRLEPDVLEVPAVGCQGGRQRLRCLLLLR
jgi:hypothetical protein